MDQNRNDTNARVAGPDTGPLPPEAPPPNQGGQPTTYVPPELRPQSTYGGYAGETPSVAPPPPPYTPAATPQTAHRDRRPHRAPLLGPLLLISAGVVFLLNNLGVLPWSVWALLGRLWPLVLIAIGIDLIIGRRNPIASALLVLAVLAAGAAFVYASGGFVGGGGVVSTQLNVRLINANSADVRVEKGVGTLTIGSMEGDDRLLATGNLEYLENREAPRQNVTESGDTANVEISEGRGGVNFGLKWFNGAQSPGWDINLNRRVPIDLEVDIGTGNATLDLKTLQIGTLKVDMGTGNARLILPSNANNTNVDINGGTGNLELIVPGEVEARIEVNSGLGNSTFDSRFFKRGEDIYETGEYASATNKVTIKVNHGIGNLNIGSK